MLPVFDAPRATAGSRIAAPSPPHAQTNTWKDDRPFVSFKKVASDIGALDGDSTLQLASFHSVSKGFLGECV